MKHIRYVLALTLVMGACSNLGLGEADCTPPERDISSASIMTAQAVPTAKYTPCLDELRLGWDETWFAEDGRAGIEIMNGLSRFLSATVTESCDTTGAKSVPSGRTDIERFENITAQAAEILISVVPTGHRPLTEANRMVLALGNLELENRPAQVRVDVALEAPLSIRIERAMRESHFVWIVDELNAEENTIDLRSDIRGASASGVSPAKAIDIIEDHLPEQFYRGFWYFTFEGGCITYEFNAEGALADTIVEDANDAFGFYPAYRVRQIAEGAGYDIIGDDD